jgi:hypothetical protein
MLKITENLPRGDISIGTNDIEQQHSDRTTKTFELTMRVESFGDRDTNSKSMENKREGIISTISLEGAHAQVSFCMKFIKFSGFAGTDLGSELKTYRLVIFIEDQ